MPCSMCDAPLFLWQHERELCGPCFKQLATERAQVDWWMRFSRRFVPEMRTQKFHWADESYH